MFLKMSARRAFCAYPFYPFHDKAKKQVIQNFPLQFNSAMPEQLNSDNMIKSSVITGEFNNGLQMMFSAFMDSMV